MSDQSGSFSLPPDVRELVEADLAASDPPVALKRELARRLERRIGLAAFALGMAEAKTAAASLAPSVAPALKAASGIAAWKWVVGASLAVAVGGGVVPMAASRMAPALHAGTVHAQSARSFDTTARKSTLITPNTSDGSRPAPSALDDSRRHQRLSASRSAGSSVDRLGEERALLDGARRALLQHDASGALQTIQLHERLYQRGELVQERESMRIKALVALGDYAGARSAGERFRRKYAHSVLVSVVDKTLEGIP